MENGKQSLPRKVIKKITIQHFENIKDENTYTHIYIYIIHPYIYLHNESNKQSNVIKKKKKFHSRIGEGLKKIRIALIVKANNVP